MVEQSAAAKNAIDLVVRGIRIKILKAIEGSVIFSDEEVQRRVDELWAQHNLKPEEALDLDRAKPYIENFLKVDLKQEGIEDRELSSIFNSIDTDGNQALEQKELFDFIKNQNFKLPNIPEKINILRKNKSDLSKSSDSNQSTLRKKLCTELYKDTRYYINSYEDQLGTLEFNYDLEELKSLPP